MSYLTLALTAKARLRGQDAAPEPGGAPNPAGPENGVGTWDALPARSSLTAAAVAGWACRGEVVTLRSRTLGGDVYLVPDAEAGAALVAAGVPRHRIYLPADLLGLAALLRLPADARAPALRAVDALREAFGPDVDVIGARPTPPEPCRACDGRRWWRSIHGPVRCVTCHPPAAPEVVVAEWVNERPPAGEPLPPWQIGEDVK